MSGAGTWRVPEKDPPDRVGGVLRGVPGAGDRWLREHLRRISGIEVTRVAGEAADGELGAWDVLQVAVPSRMAIGTLPVFIRSRRSNVTITLKPGQDRHGDRREGR
ncbi:effector-associated constant component EACC1 [Amycolatopsis sp. cmx-11-12]|uniref:effector-associated constant component EACC1 n=1 Tax=Amycolatopsis sp. cmx-11-12 TaxID=2785795 RepID=UPI003917CB6B